MWRRLGRWARGRDAGMTMTELILVIGISGMVMSMAATVTVSVLRADSRNLVREQSTAGIREVSTWLGEALTYASSPPPDAGGAAIPAVFKAGPKELGFTSALPSSGGETGWGALAKVTMKLGETCWTKQPDPGVLYRCVQGSDSVNAGLAHWCDYGAAGCDDGFFHEKVVARDVKDTADGAIFSYYLSNSPSSGTGVEDARLIEITGIEIRVTVACRSQGEAVDATVYKYFAINEWRRI
jgi:type II secretory pathway pseudopilin PulG